ncbi:MAG: hypothetical protein SGI84_10730 [Gemmatimonadota bacterium]|nr:hypothetical protein [Gemmatimonadota bacterium]
MTRRNLAAILLGTTVHLGCTPANPAEGPWVTGTPVTVESAAEFKESALVESSGVATSQQYPGIFWTHNDAGNLAHIFASDPSGAARSRWRFRSGQNVDWEDIGLGPCPAGTCLYIGDVGDNAEHRNDVTIYRFREPDPGVTDGLFDEADSLVVRYPDRPRDVEALFVDDSSTVWLVSKGRSEGIFLYRIPAKAWSGRATTAELVDTLPIRPHLAAGQAVTGAAISPDQRTVVIRTYRDLYFFSRAPDGRLTPGPTPNRCDIVGLEIQGEAVDWWNDSTLVLTSEGGAGARAAVRLVRCGGRGMGIRE